MEKVNTYVEIDTQFQALHNWPECDYAEVAYLKNLHRHIIFISVKIETFKDRGIEFFMFKEEVDGIIDGLYGKKRTKDLGRKSMEEIGKDILELLIDIYGKDRYYQIKVSEDNQVRGIVEWLK